MSYVPAMVGAKRRVTPNVQPWTKAANLADSVGSPSNAGVPFVERSPRGRFIPLVGVRLEVIRDDTAGGES